MDFPEMPRLDRSVITVARLTDPSDETHYWDAQTPQARLQALEWLRWTRGDSAQCSWASRP